ncbi:hypothetical protein DTO271G3_5671 [Paecilomyces variotii]|nr:hypothetical protein DTO271G3_5671 [Paecilomyces variotii]
MVPRRHWGVLGTSPATTDGEDPTWNSNTNRTRRTYSESQSMPRDDTAAAEAEKRRTELKKRILAGVQGFNVEQYRKSDEELKSIKNKRIRKFYEAQNQKLNDWAEVDCLVWALVDDVVDSIDPDADRDGIVDRNTPLVRAGYDLEALLPWEEREKRIKANRTVQRARNVNVLANVLLLVAKVVAVISTKSLSLIASLTDSALDLLCTMIIWLTSKLASWQTGSVKLEYPAGRQRLRPLGVLVFSILMVVSFLEILRESAAQLLPSGDHRTLTLPPVAIGTMAGNVVIKGLVGLYYFRVKNPQVQALVQDCKTDVYSNLSSLLFPLIGHKLDIWYLDPIGAALLSLLTGTAVSIQIARKLIYLAWRFSPVIDSYKSMTAYYLGDGIIVEVEITLDERTPLPLAHDIAQTIQYCFEGLAEVDRSFVTVDYSSLGLPYHAR